eukprot:94569_1
MWFYFGFLLFTFLAVIITINFASDFDINDNPIKDKFGGNNPCVFYDFAPFSRFASTLWFPIVCVCLLYELFDHFRVYDNYKEGNISKLFFKIYATPFNLVPGCNRFFDIFFCKF